MEIMNVENSSVIPLEGKPMRPTRSRRAPLTNVTNNGHTATNASFKKAKRSSGTHSVCPKLKAQAVAGDPNSYVMEIVSYLFKSEKLVGICPYYMNIQPDLKPLMRTILIDWIIQACNKFKVADETQYYSIQYIDRYLSSKTIERSDLQLVGICAIFLASKFEEISVPSMRDLCYITEDTYTITELKYMEKKMLDVLDYDLGFPTSVHILRYLVKLLSCTRQQYYNAKFLCELTSVSYRSLEWTPSVIAVSSLDILNPVNTFVPVLNGLSLEIEDSAVTECKKFMRNSVVNDELCDYETVFNKFGKQNHKKLKAALQSM